MIKIKLFLGGYINQQNAQNINCLSLVKFLNKDKFDLYTLKRSDGSIDIDFVKNSCHIQTYNNKYKFTKIWLYIYALYKCDVLYLPKQEKIKLLSFLNKLFFRKKLFLTIEGIIDDYAISCLNQDKKNSLKKYLSNIRKIDNVYSITAFMRNYNKEKVALESEENILYLGVDTGIFQTKTPKTKPLKNIIFIGNDLVRKGIKEYLHLAQLFPDLTFHIVSAGSYFSEHEENYENIKLHGSLNPDELNQLLQNIDLHVLPSKSEGYPKVVLETASVGIPSIVYSHYGANEWITTNINGFVVDDFEGLKDTIIELKRNEYLLFTSSKNAVKLATKFDWKNIIKNWEKEISSLYQLK